MFRVASSPQVFQSKYFMNFHLSHACYTPIHPTLLGLITLIMFGEAYKL